MSEQLRIILIIIVSVSIFGLLVFVFVKNYIRKKIEYYLEKKIRIKNYNKFIIFEYSLESKSIIFFEVSKSNPALAKTPISFL